MRVVPLLALGAAAYVVGVALGLIMIDARPVAKVGFALLWPIGPITFFVTVGILVAAAAIAYPLFGVALVIVGGLVWWGLF